MFTPSTEILEKYAEVLIAFALNDGNGIKEGDVVYLAAQEPAKELTQAVYRSIIKNGGHPILNIIDDDFKKVQLESGSEEQIRFFPEKYYRGLADSIDHYVRILADRDPMFLARFDPRKVILQTRSVKPFRDWLDEKEDKGEFTWTLCLNGTPGMAKEAGLSQEEYWEQIIRACFLEEDDPVAHWKSVYSEMDRIITALNELPMEKVHVTAEGTDLWVGLGEKRRWLGGRGRNIPSFEIFTSPDWRLVEGTIKFDLPLYRYGNLIENISMELRDGHVVKASAGKNEQLLQEMLRQENADRIGEFSLTDIRFSKITRFMANTLFDENFGGDFGNTHLAIGKAYHDAYDGDPRDLTEEQYREMGFNQSPEHTDIIATSDRTVEAHLRDGSKRIIYQGGQFQL